MKSMEKKLKNRLITKTLAGVGKQIIVKKDLVKSWKMRYLLRLIVSCLV